MCSAPEDWTGGGWEEGKEEKSPGTWVTRPGTFPGGLWGQDCPVEGWSPGWWWGGPSVSLAQDKTGGVVGGVMSDGGG